MSTTDLNVFAGFAPADFEVFAIDGLEPRMSALIERVRPKLNALGDELSPVLSKLTGETMFPHVAKHARRTINPPNDTWVAYAPSKRGYKMLPHFQIGLWQSHVFIQFAVIYECEAKEAFAERALRELDSIRKKVPSAFVWSKDHMDPSVIKHGKLTDDELADLFRRLKTVKAAELTCGIHVKAGDPLLSDSKAFVEKAETTFRKLLPLYKMARV